MKRIILVLLFALTNTFMAQIKYVPTDYNIIQDAIDDAKDGDIIIIEEGNYIQQFNFKGKAITIGSRFILDGDESHIENTIIDGIFLPEKDSSSLVYFISGEDSNSVLKGLTLQNGKGTQKITGNSASSFNAGGGVFLNNSGAKIENNIFKNNYLFSMWRRN